MKTQQVKVRDLKPGDACVGADGKPARITKISPCGHGQSFIAAGGEPDGIYSNHAVVERVAD